MKPEKIWYPLKKKKKKKVRVLTWHQPQNTALQLMVDGELEKAVVAFDGNKPANNKRNIHSNIFFKVVLARFPNHVRAQMNRGIALHNLGRRAESNDVWTELLPRVKHDDRLHAVCLFHLGVDFGDAGAHEDAMRLFDEALQITESKEHIPEVATVRGRIYCGKGGTFAHQGRVADAHAAWLKGFEISPTEYDNVLSLAHSYHNEQDLDNARRFYLIAVELVPSPELFCEFAQCLAQMKRVEELKTLVEYAVKFNDDPRVAASIYYRFGRAFDFCDAYAMSVEMYTKALECPERPEDDNKRVKAKTDDEPPEENINVGTPTWFAIMLMARAAARELNNESKEAVMADLDASLARRLTLDALLNKSMLCVALDRKAEAQEALAAAFALDPTGAKSLLDKFYKGALDKKANAQK